MLFSQCLRFVGLGISFAEAARRAGPPVPQAPRSRSSFVRTTSRHGVWSCHRERLASRFVSPSLVVEDCPECRGVGTIFLGSCELCFAEFGEADDLQPWRRGAPTLGLHGATATHSGVPAMAEPSGSSLP